MRQAPALVPRPRPLRRLIDGRPDEPGRVVARRAMLLLTAAVLAANVVGAIVVFVLVVWVLPLPEIEDRDTLLLINLAAEGAYVLAAGVIGTVWGVGRWRSTRRWLEEDREPTDAERRTTLRVPLRLLHISGVLWLLGAVGFFALNVWWSLLLAVIVGVTALLGGVTTGAMIYLLSERIMRSASARALARGFPSGPCSPASRRARCSPGRSGAACRWSGCARWRSSISPDRTSASTSWRSPRSGSAASRCWSA